MFAFTVEDPYLSSGFMTLQLAIERAFVEMWTDPALPKVADDVNDLKLHVYLPMHF